MFVLISLFVILILVLVLPFAVKRVEHNLEIFLFLMGLISTIVAGVMEGELVKHILKNHFLYMIAGAVLIAGFLFKIFEYNIKRSLDYILKYVPLKVIICLTIILLGLASSLITAIIASLLLVEIIDVLPLNRKEKININIIACFSIGLGAALTPVGEPLSTIVVSKLNQNFWYLLREIGLYVIPGVIVLGIIGVFFTKGKLLKNNDSDDTLSNLKMEGTYKAVFIRTLKVFVFVVALELLGAGFKIIIDTYVIKMNTGFLYWLNMISAVVDNATLAAAEISPVMTSSQIQAILMGLLISGGMLIPGNIPNIISANKLKIGSREWAKLGVPLGLIIMVVYYVIIFVI